MKTLLHRAKDRGYAEHGWLKTHHSFSFASYYDPAKMGFGALRVLNDDVIAPGAGFGMHPHDNMEIITIPLSGSLKHEDSMSLPAVTMPGALLAGNSAVVETGEIQVMSAGTGVFHAEYNASPTEPLSLFQIWIETAVPGVTPRYDQKRFEQDAFNGAFVPVVGPIGTEGLLGIHQDAWVSLGQFVAGSEVAYKVREPSHGVYVMVTFGSVAIGDTVLEARDAIGITEATEVGVRVDTDASLLVLEVPMTGE